MEIHIKIGRNINIKSEGICKHKIGRNINVKLGETYEQKIRKIYV